jgi:PleD family two-component response regulator
LIEVIPMAGNHESLVGSESLRNVAFPGQGSGLREIVIVDSVCDQYSDFVQAAQEGSVGLHFCVDGRSAVRLARRFRADVWMIAADLPDMAGFDLVEMLLPHVLQGSVDPLMGGSRISLNRVGQGMRSGIFIVSDTYRLEDEQRALAAGVAGYLVRPVTLDVIRASRLPAVAQAGTAAAAKTSFEA